MEVVTWIDPAVIGERVRVATEGPTWKSTSSGIYLGVALDEEDGVPYHYFVAGEINGIAQSSFGFPAEPGTETTTYLTPTLLIGIREQHAADAERAARSMIRGTS